MDGAAPNNNDDYAWDVPLAPGISPAVQATLSKCRATLAKSDLSIKNTIKSYGAIRALMQATLDKAVDSALDGKFYQADIQLPLDELFLSLMPEKYRVIYRCNCCLRFLRDFGSLVYVPTPPSMDVAVRRLALGANQQLPDHKDIASPVGAAKDWTVMAVPDSFQSVLFDASRLASEGDHKNPFRPLIVALQTVVESAPRVTGVHYWSSICWGRRFMKDAHKCEYDHLMVSPSPSRPRLLNHLPRPRVTCACDAVAEISRGVAMGCTCSPDAGIEANRIARQKRVSRLCHQELELNPVYPTTQNHLEHNHAARVTASVFAAAWPRAAIAGHAIETAVALLAPNSGIKNYEKLIPVTNFLRNSVVVYNTTQADIDAATAMTGDPAAAAEKLLKASRRRSFWLHRAVALHGAPLVCFRASLAWHFISMLDTANADDPDGEYVRPDENAGPEAWDEYTTKTNLRHIQACDMAVQVINRMLAGDRYQRPTRDPREAELETAMALIDQLGLTAALARRRAALGELTLFEWKQRLPKHDGVRTAVRSKEFTARVRVLAESALTGFQAAASVGTAAGSVLDRIRAKKAAAAAAAAATSAGKASTGVVAVDAPAVGGGHGRATVANDVVSPAGGATHVHASAVKLSAPAPSSVLSDVSFSVVNISDATGCKPPRVIAAGAGASTSGSDCESEIDFEMIESEALSQACSAAVSVAATPATLTPVTGLSPVAGPVRTGSFLSGSVTGGSGSIKFGKLGKSLLSESYFTDFSLDDLDHNHGEVSDGESNSSAFDCVSLSASKAAVPAAPGATGNSFYIGDGASSVGSASISAAPVAAAAAKAKSEAAASAVSSSLSAPESAPESATESAPAPAPESAGADGASVATGASAATADELADKPLFWRHDDVVPAERTTYREFMANVAPHARQMWLRVGPRDAYAGLSTQSDPAAPPLVWWDRAEQRNPLCMYTYAGGSKSSWWNVSPTDTAGAGAGKSVPEAAAAAAAAAAAGGYVAIEAIVRRPEHWYRPPTAAQVHNSIAAINAAAAGVASEAAAGNNPDLRAAVAISSAVRTATEAAHVAAQGEAEIVAGQSRTAAGTLWVVRGARHRKAATACVFPEAMRRELAPVRRTIEAVSNAGVMGHTPPLVSIVDDKSKGDKADKKEKKEKKDKGDDGYKSSGKVTESAQQEAAGVLVTAAERRLVWVLTKNGLKKYDVAMDGLYTK